MGSAAFMEDLLVIKCVPDDISNRDLDFVTPADIFCRCEGGYVNDRFCILLHFDFLPLFKIILYIDLLIDTGTETQTCEHSVVAVNLSVKQSFGQFAGLSFGKRPPIGII